MGGVNTLTLKGLSSRAVATLRNRTHARFVTTTPFSWKRAIAHSALNFRVETPVKHRCRAFILTLHPGLHAKTKSWRFLIPGSVEYLSKEARHGCTLSPSLIITLAYCLMTCPSSIVLNTSVRLKVCAILEKSRSSPNFVWPAIRKDILIKSDRPCCTISDAHPSIKQFLLVEQALSMKICTFLTHAGTRPL